MVIKAGTIVSVKKSRIGYFQSVDYHKKKIALAGNIAMGKCLALPVSCMYYLLCHFQVVVTGLHIIEKFNWLFVSCYRIELSVNDGRATS